MSSEWRQVTLGDLLDVKHGYAFRGEYFREEKTSDVLLTPGNFSIGGGFRDAKLKYYQGPVEDDYVLKTGDLVITMTDLSKEADTLGYPVLIPPTISGERYLHNQRIGKIILKSDAEVDIRFLYYLLCSKPYRNEIVGSATGTTVKHTAPERIKRFQFSIPALPDQRAIAHVLGTLDDKIELNRRMNETIELMARALFKSWFIDFDPVRAKMDGRWKKGYSLPGLSAELFDLFPDELSETNIGAIPRGWSIGTLGTIAQEQRRGIATKDIESGTPYIALEHMPRRNIALSQWGISDGLESNKLQFRAGEILFGKLRPYFHKVGVAPLDGICSTDIVVLGPKVPVWRGFVLEIVSSEAFVSFTNANSTGTKMPRTSWTDMARYPCVCPDEELVTAFEAQTLPVMQKIVASIFESKSLEQIRNIFLPRLISGDLRIQDANAFLRARGL
jgi:type I restriction enzyme S subunit